jgi:predicted enzyme related to lactoylglutathione lyase
MEKVTGIGGVFFRSRDPQKLADWYRENLGLPIAEESTYGVLESAAAGEGAVWSTFPSDTAYFRSEAQWMVNYRVRDLDAMLDQLRAAGAEVEPKIEEFDYGRFGWACDPEGNWFELWQPK